MHTFMAGCMVLEDPAPDVCIRQILNFGHCQNVSKCLSKPGFDLSTSPSVLNTSANQIRLV